LYRKSIYYNSINIYNKLTDDLFESVSNKKLHKPVVRLTLYQRSIYYNNINIYNKLSDDLFELVSNKKCFPLQLKNYLTDKPFYSVGE